MLDKAAAILIYACLWTAGVAIGVFALREWVLRLRQRRLDHRMHNLRRFLDDFAGEHADAYRIVRRRFSAARDLETLERLLHERGARITDNADEDEVREIFESYDSLGILDRYIKRLTNAHRWAERAFAARVLGEIGSAKAVEPLIAVMRNTREEDRDVRMAASRALGRIRDPRALAPLIEALALPETWLPPRVAEVILQFGRLAHEPLLAQLSKREDTSARAWAAEILGELQDPKAVPALRTCLADLQDQVRARAAGALGKIADRRAVPDLIHLMLADPVPYVRIQSVGALGAIGDPRALHHLIDSLKDGEWWVRVRVIEALEHLGEQATEPLLMALEDHDHEVRQRAAMTLERLGVLDELLERVGDGDVGAREKLMAAGQAGVVEILISALSNANPRVRYAIAEILGEVRHEGATAALIERLSMEHAAPIVAEVLRALARLRAEAAAEPISHLLGHENHSIRVEAVRALERIPFPNPNELLANAVRDPEARVRAGSAAVLGKVGDPESVPALLPLLGDCDASVRAEAARALGLLRARDAVDRLVDAFHDYEPEVQVAAARALGQIGDSESLETLVRGLENASPELGEAIAWALGQIRWTDPERVIDVLFQGADRTSRLGALDVLGQISHPAGRELIRSMLGDGDEVVVCRAVRILGELEDEQAVGELLELLQSPSETVRIEVLNALSRIDVPDVLPGLRDAVFDPSETVRARAVLVLGTLRDGKSADVLRGVLASPRSTDEMRGYALLGLMAMDRDSDLPAILEALESFPLYDFLQDKKRTRDPVLHATVEAVRTARSVEFMVASTRARDELEQGLVRQLEFAQDEKTRVKVVRTLGFLNSQKTYPAIWRTFHKDPSEDVRLAALEFLAERAPQSDFVRLLLAGIQDLQPLVRGESMRRLHRVDVDQALEVVVSQLDTEDESVLEALVEFLAALSTARLEAFLDGVLGTDLTLRARRALVRIVGRARFKGAARLLAAYLEEDEPELRRAAVETLGLLAGREVPELLRGGLEDPDLEVRRLTLDAAARQGATAAAPLLRQGLEDPAAELRRRAILHLARLRPQELAEDLQSLTRDPEPRVRCAALAALALDGTEPIEEWIGPKDVQGISEALREIHPAQELEIRLTSSRRVGERAGALRALFLRDPRRRARALAAVRQDPSKRVRSIGARLEEILQVWMLDPEAERYLGEVPFVRANASREKKA